MHEQKAADTYAQNDNKVGFTNGNGDKVPFPTQIKTPTFFYDVQEFKTDDTFTKGLIVGTDEVAIGMGSDVFFGRYPTGGYMSTVGVVRRRADGLCEAKTSRLSSCE